MQSGCTRPAAVAGWPWVRNPDLVCPGFARIRTRPVVRGPDNLIFPVEVRQHIKKSQAALTLKEE